jgi:CRISPR-associated endoribonuclease Cas6
MGGSFMYQLNISLASKTKPQNTWVLARRLHAFVLHSIQSQDPNLSQALHDRKDRQLFSIHPGFKVGAISVRTPNKDVVKCLQSALLEEDLIDLNDWKGKIQALHCESMTLNDVMRDFSTKITFHFITPTTFYQWGNYYPLPELQRLFSSGAKSLAIAEHYVVDWAQIEPLLRKIRVEDLHLSTKRVNFGTFNVVGFEGKMVINSKALPIEDQQLIWKLAAYGSLMGFGYKTAWGLGQTQLKELSGFTPFMASLKSQGWS